MRRFDPAARRAAAELRRPSRAKRARVHGRGCEAAEPALRPGPGSPGAPGWQRAEVTSSDRRTSRFLVPGSAERGSRRPRCERGARPDLRSPLVRRPEAQSRPARDGPPRRRDRPGPPSSNRPGEPGAPSARPARRPDPRGSAPCGSRLAPTAHRSCRDPGDRRGCTGDPLPVPRRRHASSLRIR